MLFYCGHKITPYDYYKLYKEGDCVQFNDKFYQCRVCNMMRYPYAHTYYWQPIPEEEQKDEMKIVHGNNIGNISDNNVVIYGNNTGNIITTGEKSVVVVFGDVVGDIRADQVIHVHDVDKTEIKEALAHVKNR